MFHYLFVDYWRNSHCRLFMTSVRVISGDTHYIFVSGFMTLLQKILDVRCKIIDILYII